MYSYMTEDTIFYVRFTSTVAMQAINIIIMTAVTVCLAVFVTDSAL